VRILFLSTWFPYPPDNGSKLRVYHLLRELGTRHEISLCSFAFDTARPDQSSEFSHYCRSTQVVGLNPFDVNRASTLRTFLSLRPMASRPIAAMRDHVGRLIRQTPFDVVIASTEMMADYALMLPESVTRILEEHNSSVRWMRGRYERQTSMVQRLRCWTSWQKTRWYAARLFPKFDLCTMVSESDREASLQMLPGYRGRVEVVPNGVDCARNRPGLAGPQPGRLVYNGSLTYSANYDAMRWFLAEIYPRIRAADPDVTLTITGSTACVNLAGLTLDDTVRLTGFVDDVRLPVAEAAVCVVPIRQGGGTRLKILEAMALGTPVVSTSKGAEGLDVIDGEHLLIADDPQNFAEAVMRLLNDASRCRRLAAQARRLVEERYNWAAIGAAFTTLVEDTVERGRMRKDRR
jgi:polysaccharide biosynthesis protein PslH